MCSACSLFLLPLSQPRPGAQRGVEVRRGQPGRGDAGEKQVMGAKSDGEG